MSGYSHPAASWRDASFPLMRTLKRSVKNPREAAAVRLAERRTHAMASVLRRYACLLAVDARLEEAYDECWRGIDMTRYAACIPVLVGLRAANARRRRQRVAEVHSLAQELQRIAAELRRFAEGNRCFAAEMRERLQPQTRSGADGVERETAGPSSAADDGNVLASAAGGLIDEYTQIANLEEMLAKKISACGVDDDETDEEDTTNDDESGGGGGDGVRHEVARTLSKDDTIRGGEMHDDGSAARLRGSTKRRRKSGENDDENDGTVVVACRLDEKMREDATDAGREEREIMNKENINSQGDINTPPDSAAIVNPTPPSKVRIVASETRTS